MKRSRGFTLVEMTVVIAIITILLSLLLPAINYAREAARKIQCSSNLQQIGLGLRTYSLTYKAFPPGYVYGPIEAATSTGSTPTHGPSTRIFDRWVLTPPKPPSTRC